MSKDVVAIIPVPAEASLHLRPLAGRPLVIHSIEHALRTPAIGATIVSTSDDQVAAISTAAGARVAKRPADLSGDDDAAVVHALTQLRTADRIKPKTVILLSPASPIRAEGDAANALRLFTSEKADTLLSVCPAHGLLWTKAARSARPNRAQGSPRFRENGSISVVKAARSKRSGRIALFEMDQARSFRVETESDFALCEALLAARPSAPPRTAGVKLLVFDFDGVMSDNRVLVMQDGTEGVLCNRSDGLGIGMLRDAGLPMLVLSKEENPVVSARCRKLKLDCRQGINDKLVELKSITAERGISLAQVAYVGNDVNDVACMRAVGLSIAVADAWPEARAAARAHTTRAGGHGAVREVCNWFLESAPGGKA